VLWKVTHGYGAAGALCTAGAILASLAAAWFGGRLATAAQPKRAAPAAPRAPIANTAPGSGVARRRRLRTGAARR
jgi:hypothetical protein